MKRPVSPLLPVVLACALLGACHDAPPPAVEAPRPVRVTTIDPNAAVGARRFAGQVVARQTSALAFDVGGRVVERRVDPGARVRRGDLLLRVEDDQQSVQVGASQASVDAQVAEVAHSRTELARSEALLAQGFATQSEVDRDRQQLTNTQARLDEARAKLATDRLHVGDTRLYADHDGVIAAVDAQVGDSVTQGQSVVTLAADGPRDVAIELPEDALGLVRAARRIVVMPWDRHDVAREGRLHSLAADADPATRTYAARIAVDDARDLALGGAVQLRIESADRPPAPALPLAALRVRDAAHPEVWVVDPTDQTLHARRIAVQGVDGISVRVADGLKPGDVVVTAGAERLHEGQAVRIVAREEAAR